MLKLDLTRSIFIPISARDIERNKDKKIVGWSEEDLAVEVSLEDSLAVENCVPGTHAWIARHFGRKHTTATVRAVLEAALRSGDSYDHAEKACRLAVSRRREEP